MGYRGVQSFALRWSLLVLLLAADTAFTKSEHKSDDDDHSSTKAKVSPIVSDRRKYAVGFTLFRDEGVYLVTTASLITLQ